MRIKSYLNVMLITFSLLVSQHANSATVNAEIGRYVDHLMNEFFAITKDSSLDDNAKITKARDALAGNMDFDWMGGFVLGRYRRTMSPEEIRQFVDIYKDYVINAYANAVREYKGEKITVRSEQPISDNEYAVRTEISTGPGQQPLIIDYMVRQYPDKTYKVFDIVTEGVSLISSQQSEFGSVIASSGLPALEESLKAKTKK